MVERRDDQQCLGWLLNGEYVTPSEAHAAYARVGAEPGTCRIRIDPEPVGEAGCVAAVERQVLVRLHIHDGAIEVCAVGESIADGSRRDTGRELVPLARWEPAGGVRDHQGVQVSGDSDLGVIEGDYDRLVSGRPSGWAEQVPGADDRPGAIGDNEECGRNLERARVSRDRVPEGEHQLVGLGRVDPEASRGGA